MVVAVVVISVIDLFIIACLFTRAGVPAFCLRVSEEDRRALEGSIVCHSILFGCSRDWAYT